MLSEITLEAFIEDAKSRKTPVKLNEAIASITEIKSLKNPDVKASIEGATPVRLGTLPKECSPSPKMSVTPTS